MCTLSYACNFHLNSSSCTPAHEMYSAPRAVAHAAQPNLQQTNNNQKANKYAMHNPTGPPTLTVDIPHRSANMRNIRNAGRGATGVPGGAKPDWLCARRAGAVGLLARGKCAPLPSALRPVVHAGCGGWLGRTASAPVHAHGRRAGHGH